MIVIDPINEEILLKSHQGLSIRQIADLPGMPTRNAIHERLREMETQELAIAPGANNERWRPSELGLEILKGHGLI